ncbi:MAG: O-antigen ligase family protein [Burkholderiales bacterium]|nr:O-antigen ligase family protein [Burkholderiales bacterium]
MKPIFAPDLTRAWGVPLLIAACIVLLPLGRSVELPMAVMAITGLVWLVRRPGTILGQTEFKLFMGLFACLWLPMALASFDAIHRPRAVETTLVFLRFLFMGACMLYWLRAPQTRTRVTAIVGVALAFWVLDGLVQALRGVNLFGQPMIDGQLTGVFHPKQTMGMVLATLTPVFLLWLGPLARRRPVLWLLVPAYAVVILLTGKRAAWLLSAIALVMVAVWALRSSSAKRRHLWAAGLAVCVLVGGLAWQSPHFQAKWQVTTGLFSADAAKADAATSYRLTIWRVGVRMFEDHWVNGIGPRSFRNLYPDYAQEGDLFMQLNPHSGPTHPHQITLEIAVESGVIGLAGFALLWGWIVREWLRAWRVQATAYLAWLTAAALALFPLNAANALYDAFWSGVSFWLLLMALAHRPPPAAHDA